MRSRKVDSRVVMPYGASWALLPLAAWPYLASH